MQPILPHLTAVVLSLCLAAPATAQPVARTISQGLAHPWAVAFLPDGHYLVTERAGTLRVVEPGGRIRGPVQGVPVVQARGQGGLLDLALDRDFTRNRTLYFCYAEPSVDGRTAGRGGSTGGTKAQCGDSDLI